MPDPKSTTDLSATAAEPNPIDETLLAESSQPSDAFSKQEVDLACAVVALRAGRVNERNLARALQGWTIYGAESLVDRLVSASLISPDERQPLLAEAEKCLQLTDHAVGRTSEARTQSQLTSARVAQLDSGGRISKLLGLSQHTGMVTGDAARQLFARYSLIRKLGEGGLGTVWLARDENLRRYVAIKEIRSRGSAESPAAIARFRREAEVTGGLEHPGIVPVYQFGTDSESGRYFYVMRFLGKHTMHDAIAEYHERREAGNHEPLLMHRLLSSFVKLCDSVAHAHSRKVIHRDLKPENVALDSFGQVVLLDWGLAKINDETGVADASLGGEAHEGEGETLTVASQVLGSPMYMAPEQAAGRIDEIDERTDVYGLGGILFAILTGQPPHEDTLDGSAPSSMSDLLAAIVGRTSLRPKDVVATVPAELDAICRKATQQKRYLRYPSAAAIAEDVERYMAGDKVSAYEEPTGRRFMRWVAAHPKLSQLAGALAVLFLLTMFVVGYSFRQAHLAEDAFRFQQATDVAQELAFYLQSQAERVIGDSRFMTGLPPVQGIIAARNPTSEDVEDESVWRDRFSAIFEGLLRRNESYLAVIFLSVDLEAQEIQQLLKWERNVGAQLIRRVPDSQLGAFPVSDDGVDLETMMPGDVELRTSDKLTPDAPTRFRDALSLTAVNSVFDDSTAELFGLMAIQLDLRRMIRERIEESRREATCVYITDGSGTIQMSYKEGRFISGHEGSPITKLLPELSPVFTDDSVQHTYSDGETVYATRLRLGQEISTSQADVGIVVQVVE